MCFGRARLEKSVLLGGLGETEKTTFYPSLLPNEAPEGQGRLTRLLQGPMWLIGAGCSLAGPGLSCLRGEIVAKNRDFWSQAGLSSTTFQPCFSAHSGPEAGKEATKWPKGPNTIVG